MVLGGLLMCIGGGLILAGLLYGAGDSKLRIANWPIVGLSGFLVLGLGVFVFIRGHSNLVIEMGGLGSSVHLYADTKPSE